jgi:hypothetical protein
VIAIGLVGLTTVACAARPFDDTDEFGEDDEFGETDDEFDSSEESSSSTSTTSTTSTTGESESESESEGPDPDLWETEESTSEESTSEESTSEESTSEESTGDGDGDGAPNGSSCVGDRDCMSNNCYVVPFLGGQCGECNEDADCNDGGCTPPNPFEPNGSFCNMGELGGGCESSEVCMPGLVCGNVLDLLGLIQINSCGTCTLDSDCTPDQICAPVAEFSEFSGFNDCIDPGSRPQDSFCQLEGNGDEACTSGICSTVDIMGLAEIGACGECNTDFDCPNGTCVPGELVLDTGTLTGSTCQP